MPALRLVKREIGTVKLSKYDSALSSLLPAHPNPMGREVLPSDQINTVKAI
jgi:hypothetical protein